MSKTFLSAKERRGLLFLSLIIVVTISAGLIRSCMPRQNYVQQIVVPLQDTSSLTADSFPREEEQQKETKSKRKSKQSKSRKKSSYKERKPLENIVPSK